MTEEHLSSSGSSTLDLHATVREALAGANSAVKAMGSTLLQTSLDPAVPGVGPVQLRRLYTFYAHGQSSGLSEKQVRADLAWLADHFDEWVARQEQAQQDARSLFETLHATCPLPTIGDDEQDRAVALVKKAHALKKDPGHWANQPWMQRLMGRWTEDLPDAVAEARQWLAKRSVEMANSHQSTADRLHDT